MIELVCCERLFETSSSRGGWMSNGDVTKWSIARFRADRLACPTVTDQQDAKSFSLHV